MGPAQYFLVVTTGDPVVVLEFKVVTDLRQNKI